MSLNLALSIIAVAGVVVLALAAANQSAELRFLKQQVVSLRKLSGIDAKLLDVETRGEVAAALPTASRGAMVLVIDEGCSICEEVVPLFAQLMAAEDNDGFAAVVVSRSRTRTEGAERVRHLADPRLHHHLDPGYLPAMHYILPDGEPGLTEPVGSREGLIEAMALAGVKVKV
ncbi:hypothetical protein [Pimelobacter simplex]|uniref:hypothetical protein n=1 Tax=Nocardioides simplex TaxID=2045 RepID=UPI001931C944|nr:hypothetical protein [Pimelobacter simplex]